MNYFPSTVITPHLMAREVPLVNAMRSVQHQLLPPAAQFIGTDITEVGEALIRNSLISGVDTEYVTFLDDDDFLYPEYFSTIAEQAPDADWIFTNWELGPGRAAPLALGWVREAFDHMNIVPMTGVTIRTSLVKAAGGFRNVFQEDYDLWRRIVADGVEPVFVDRPLWMYGMIRDEKGGSNGTRAEGQEESKC